jgi:predicted DNA-binding transcriptional regulator AlpA
MVTNLVEPISNKAVRAREAAQLLSVSRATFYLLLKNRRFPQGTRLGRCRVWLPSDLIGWLQMNRLGSKK